MAKPKYIIRDPEGLNLKFYQKYDEGFLYRKADTLLFIADKHEEFRKFVQENDGDVESIDSKFVETLRAEVHFTEFHQFEAFFALLIAIFQGLPHWLYLTTYSTREIKQKVKAFLDKDINTLTNGELNSLEDFLNYAIYAGFMSNKQEIANNWQTNLDNIAWVLSRMSQKYLNGIEYNAYKHGIRIITGPSYVKFTPSDNPQGGFGFSSDDSVRFLEIEEGENNTKVVRETFKHFNPSESINHLFVMAGLLETTKAVRLARLQGEKEVASLNTFSKLDKDALNKTMTRTRWSVTV